jgi:peptide subunit release factor 1 (eRF1)
LAQAQDLRQAIGEISALDGPILSAYINVDPGVSQNQEQAYEVRARNAMDELGVPEAVADSVRHTLMEERPKARTMAIFAHEKGRPRVYRLQAAMPETVRWGEPNVSPLLLTLDEQEPYGVALVDAENFRYFVISRIQAPDEEAEDVKGSGYLEVDTSPSTPGPRGGMDRDVQGQRTEHNIAQFYNELGDRIRDITFKQGVKRLILAGPKERTSDLRSRLPQDVSNRVVAEENVSLDAPDGDILDHLEGVRENAEHERARELLAEIRESGVSGLGRTVEALQVENRVHHLALLWDLEGEIRWSDDDQMAVADITQTESPSGASTRVRPLVDVVLDLAANYGVRVDFMRGEDENAVALRDEFGGIAGLTRF